MSLKEGDPEHVRGYILYKLYWYLHSWVIPGKDPKRHYPLTDMKKGYPKQWWGRFDKEFKELRREGLVHIFSHIGGGEDHICAVKAEDAVVRGLVCINKYLASEKMPNLTIDDLFPKSQPKKR